MDREERELRHAAASMRTFARMACKGSAALAIAQGIQLDHAADVAALAGLDLFDLYAPTPGDAVALRGGVLAGERWRPLADGFASAVDAAREVTP